MAQQRDDQFHRDKSFSQGDAAPRGTEPRDRHLDQGTGDLEEDIAARGANPDPTGVTSSMPSEQSFSKPNTLNPTNDQRQTGKQQFIHGPGQSSEPSSAGAPSTSAKDVARAQGIDMKASPAKNPPDVSTQGEGSELSPGIGESMQPRGNADADALLTEPDRAEGRL